MRHIPAVRLLAIAVTCSTSAGDRGMSPGHLPMVDPPRVLNQRSCETGDVPPLVIPLVVAKNRIHKAPCANFPKASALPLREPSIVSLHTLHILWEPDPDKLVYEFVRMVVKEPMQTRSRTNYRGLVLLDKHVRSGQCP